MEQDSTQGGGETLTSLLMQLSMYTAAINAILLLVLMAIYARVYKDTKAQFSLGLIMFAALLFAQNLLAVYSFAAMAPFIGDPFLPYLLTINVAQTLGVVILLATTAQ